MKKIAQMSYLFYSDINKYLYGREAFYTNQKRSNLRKLPILYDPTLKRYSPVFPSLTFLFCLKASNMTTSKKYRYSQVPKHRILLRQLACSDMKTSWLVTLLPGQFPTDANNMVKSTQNIKRWQTIWRHKNSTMQSCHHPKCKNILKMSKKIHILTLSSLVSVRAKGGWGCNNDPSSIILKTHYFPLYIYAQDFSN